MACPFGAPSFDSESGVMTKCHLCSHRLSEGEAPACVVACPTKALDFSFGDPEQDRFIPAVESPGFQDPCRADPGFWIAPPSGGMREEWYSRLSKLMGGGEGDHEEI